MADLDDLDPKDLPGFSDHASATGQAGADPGAVASADEDAAPASADEPDGPRAHPFYDDDDASLGRD